MDNITHALAGALLGAATIEIVRRHHGEPAIGLRRAAYAIGIVTAELPDADLVYAGDRLGIGTLGYMLHHRGHTHTVVFAVLAAFLVWGIALAWRRGLREPAYARPLLCLALVGSLSHIALDFTNSYGVHPWWPIDNRWFYGDAVFIIEPWLFVAAIPPLFFVARSVGARTLCLLVAGAILAAVWRVELVGPALAITLTVAMAAWAALVWWAPPGRRVAMGLTAWMAFEALSFATSGLARRSVEGAVAVGLRDVVITPGPGNPFCLSAIVVTDAASTYEATSAVVAAVPGLVPVGRCGPAVRGLVDGVPSRRADTAGIRWGTAWSATTEELRTFAESNCAIDAALEFMRVPAWRRLGNDRVEFYDLRFGAGGFASIVTPLRPGACPGWRPGWIGRMGA
ncbi:MAG: metal-dependent hydrolase [Gemmatimonadaceae bacterium]|nr:metal-dependent hydrolase [Gemmatimonadaceae bacterium]